MKIIRISKTTTLLFLLGAAMWGLTGASKADLRKKKLHCISTPDADALKTLLRYSDSRVPLVSTHRGGTRKGFPENCIATFENTLSQVWSVLEIDPRYTKDSAIVLMHDPTLERTSNGTGQVSQHTLEELKRLRLKDSDGNLTPYTIPTLDEAIRWARGKTVLVVDQKDVPVEARVKKIQEHRAQGWVALIVYNLEDVKKCYRLDPGIVMEVMIADSDAMAQFEKTGVPWENVIAFVTHTTPKDTTVFRKLHEKKVMCIRGSSRTIDRAFTEGKLTAPQLAAQYREMIQTGTDIIEADLGIEAGMALSELMPANLAKNSPYFRYGP